MELSALFIFIFSFVVCAVIVAVVSWMGSKEKSYEEAIEETKKKSSPVSGQPGKQQTQQQHKKKENKLKSVKGGSAKGKAKSPKDEAPSEEEITPEVKEVKKKEMMIIEEVIEVKSSAPSLSATPPSKDTETQGKATNKKAKKAPKEDSKKSSDVVSVRHILSLVERTAMDEGECQHLIDVLLNKQVGEAASLSQEWIQNSRSGAASVKNLQKQIQEKELELEESKSRIKSLSDKLGQLRQELNASTLLLKNSQRIVDEMRAKHERDMSALQSTQAQHVESRNRECASLQNRLTAQITLTQQLEAKLNQLGSASAVDAGLAQEVEQLRAVKNQLESQIGPLTVQVESFKQVEEHLKGKLSSSEKKWEETCALHQGRVQELQAQVVSLEEAVKSESAKSNQCATLQLKVQEMTTVKGDMEAKATEMQRSLEKAQKVIQEKEENITRLAEEAERLSEQLASTVERPKAEGQEDNGDMNGLQEIVNSNESWQNKYDSIVKERDDMVKKHERVVSSLKTEMDSAKSQAVQISGDLEAQRAKNNELREKNWKAMEALKDAELKIVNQSQNNTQVMDAVSQAREELMENQKQFLMRLLPDVRIHNSDFNTWISHFEGEFQNALANSKSSASESATTISKLEERVSNYQSILSETENMLHQLESSVASEEGQWKSRLLEKEKEIEELRRDRDRLNEKNSALDESINVVKQAEEALIEEEPPHGITFAFQTLERALPSIVNEMQVKLHELQEKLGSEEKEKKELLTRISKLSSFESDNAKLNEELSSLKSTNRSMGERIVKMDHIMSTGQEALQHEQKTVLVMRDQIQNLHKNSNEAHAENGLNGNSVNGNDVTELNGDTPHGSLDSLAKNKKKKKKSKKDSQKA